MIPGIYVEGIIKFFIFPLTNDFPGFTLIVGFVNLSNKFRLSYLIKLLSLYIIQLKNTVWHLLKISLYSDEWPPAQKENYQMPII